MNSVRRDLIASAKISFFADAKKASRDPTSTTTLRHAFRSAAGLRLRQLSAMTRIAIVDNGMIGSVTTSFMSPSSRISLFNSWFSAITNVTLCGGYWFRPWFDKCLSSGLRKANSELHSGTIIMPGTMDHYYQLGDQELEGIAANLIQKVSRAVFNGVNANQKSVDIFWTLKKAFADTGNRLNAFVAFMTVKLHNSAKLQVYREIGVTRFGIIPETVPQKQKRKKSIEFPIYRKIGGSIKIGDAPGDYEQVEEVMGVLTAGDDLVCDECESIAEDSPYSIDDIQNLLPAHPNCRCAIYPWFDDRFAHDKESL